MKNINDSNEKKEKVIRKFKIYVHINKYNGKLYIGQTCKDERIRWNNGKGYIGCHHFFNAIQKYGWDNYDHIILFEVNSQELANISEEFLIKKYKSNNPIYGYNILSGGSNLCGSNNPNYGNKYSEETKNRMSIISKKRLSNKENHPRYGVHLSNEVKEKIRKSNSKKYTEEQRINKLLSDKNIHKLSVYDRQLNYIKTFLCVNDAQHYVRKKFHISFLERPFYIDDKYIFTFDEKHNEIVKSEEFINSLKNYGKKYNQRQVICLNDLTIYESLSKAGKSKNISEGKISMCCNKRANYAGYDEKLGKLIWEFYDETKQYEISKYIPKNLKQCKCLTTDRLFNSTKEASDEYAINKNTIAWACNPNNKNNKTNGGNTGYDSLYWKYS